MLYFLLILIAIFIVIGLFLPKDYTVSRSIVIDSDSETIHQYVGDLSNWELWSPWIESDPTLEIKLGEKTKGEGASQSWRGEDGSGSLTFVKSDPERGVQYDLDFNDGQYKCVASFDYESQGDSTKVTWNMQGSMDVPIIGGYLASKVDSLVGLEFEKGLEKLKNVVENKNN